MPPSLNFLYSLMIIVVKIFHFHLVAAREDLKDDYCFICIVLSYGQDGVITCYDETHSPKDPTADMQLPVSELQGCLKGDKCKKLLLKPKIFMLQVNIMPHFNFNVNTNASKTYIHQIPVKCETK